MVPDTFCIPQFEQLAIWLLFLVGTSHGSETLCHLSRVLENLIGPNRHIWPTTKKESALSRGGIVKELSPQSWRRKLSSSGHNLLAAG